MSGEYDPEVVRDLHTMVAQGLPRWGLAPSTTIELLNLSENATFGLSDPVAQRHLVLRVHRVGYSTAQQIRSELAWVQALHSSGTIETANPQPAIDGELVQTLVSAAGKPSRYAVAFERLRGTEPSAGDDAAPWFERLGELTARMHRHAKIWRPPPDFNRRRWDLDGMVGVNAHWGPWQAALGLDAQGKAVLREALLLIGQRLERFGIDPARFGLIHADLRLANLLVDAGHLRIIDFDDCGFSWFLYDFATAVSFIEEQPILPSLLRAWLIGYSKVTVLSVEELAEIPTFVVLRRIVLTAWLASHSEVSFARQFGSVHTQATVELARQLLAGTFLNEFSVA
jgi:Ser/Thr protein kinase RdoA (MazF antagonist)